MDPIWPGSCFWFWLGVISSLASGASFLNTNFIIKKITGVFYSFTLFIVLITCVISNVKLHEFYSSLSSPPRNQETHRFFCNKRRIGKTIGFSILLFGNVGLYHFSEKSAALMLTFLFLALYSLCLLFWIQPCTHFGVLDFFVSASLNQTLSLFNIRSLWFWLGMSAYAFIAAIRHNLEPEHFQPTSDRAPVEALQPREERRLQPRKERRLQPRSERRRAGEGVPEQTARRDRIEVT